MRILIVSDSHGDRNYIDEAITRVEPDQILHLGDAQGDEDHFAAVGGCPVTVVRGNCDTDLSIPLEREITIGPRKILMAHGHMYGGSPGTIEPRMVKKARQDGCSIVMYGHTHIPVLHETPELTVLNPGSIARPRQDGRKHTYLVMEITPKGQYLFNPCTL